MKAKRHGHKKGLCMVGEGVSVRIILIETTEWENVDDDSFWGRIVSIASSARTHDDSVSTAWHRLGRDSR